MPAYSLLVVGILLASPFWTASEPENPLRHIRHHKASVKYGKILDRYIDFKMRKGMENHACYALITKYVIIEIYPVMYCILMGVAGMIMGKHITMLNEFAMATVTNQKSLV